MILVRGNSKLGRNLHSFDIPAKSTCPGSTPVCRANCYALRGRFATGKVKARLEASRAFSRKATFADAMIALVESEGAKVVRIHSSGDLYSPEYARKWLAVMKAVPGTRFYFYTRSWHKKAFSTVLRAMAKLPNVRLWYSADKDSGVPRAVPKGVKVAYMQTDADDVPKKADLVFRTHSGRKILAKTVPDASGKPVVVCPTETGLPGAKDVTCGSCKLCWRDETPVAGRVSLAVV